MEELLLDILEALRARGPAPQPLETKELAGIIRRHNEGRGGAGSGLEPFSKKQLLPYYRRVKAEDPARWRSWGIDDDLERALVATLRMKPGRTASGVATITVLTKPWPCSGDCLYCPNDLRMPKSYLHREPACQRAERSCFDPYLQVASRLGTLEGMGHVTDKVELIVLGGTWDDYPRDYQRWFVAELFAALNDGEEERRRRSEERRAFYRSIGVADSPEEAQAFVEKEQRAVDAGVGSYNEAVRRLYGGDAGWSAAAAEQHIDESELARRQRANEGAAHRCVGLVVETRPDAVTPDSLRRARRLGCTKIQMGIQSLDDGVLAQNSRSTGRADVERAFELLRLFGFKTHVHAMLNLRGSSPVRDEADYRELVEDPAFRPDEVKLYPCALVGGTGLSRLVESDAEAWRPYAEEELLDLLAADEAATPAWTRISRMIRDISAEDILAGNKKTNLRERVEARLDAQGAPVEEMRHREVRGREVDPAALQLSDVPYGTTVSREHFLQWTTPDDELAGFLRLSLPKPECVAARADELPVAPGEAMIREVHVYGRVAALDSAGQNAQHLGLGRRLVQEACDIARAEGYAALNVISAVGTREYYRHLGFSDHGLYLQKEL